MAGEREPLERYEELEGGLRQPICQMQAEIHKIKLIKREAGFLET
jgi:hypothetical protein